MFEDNEINESKKIMKSLNVIIYGTIRDIESHFLKSFTNIELLSDFFNKVHIIIFENDSSDNTRKLLIKWESHKNKNIDKKLLLKENLIHKFPLRAHRLAYCRNQILNYIFDNNLDKKYQYAIHCDLDDRFWSLDFYSICNCFQYDVNKWDAMFPINTNYGYYDFWALRCDLTWFNKNIFCCEIENNDKFNEYEKHVPEFCSFLKNNANKLISVQSAFNGLGIYKLNSLKNCRYNADYNCTKCKGKILGCLEDNDHIGLHKSMIQNNCKLYINTKMFIESKKEEYMSYPNFITNLKNIPSIQKNPLQYVLYKKIVDTNHLWLNFSEKIGTFENIISNFTSNNIYSFCLHDNDLYSNDLINNNVIKYAGNISKYLYNFIVNNEKSLISFIHIDLNDYHNTRNIFDILYKKIKNGCIIVIHKFMNTTKNVTNDMHAFYEFLQKYNMKFEYIGVNNSKSHNHDKDNNTSVAIKIINNPYEPSQIINNNFHTYDKNDKDDFDWTTYIKKYEDLKSIKTKEEAFYHWTHHGKKEGREYYTLKKSNTKNEYNNTEKYNKTKEYNDDKECEYDNFDWEKYIKKYTDLKKIKTKEAAWNHWIHYGKKEGRKYYITSNYNISENFDWKYYIENNADLKDIKTKEEAWEHWLHFGKKEGRNISFKNCIKFSNFDWRYYVRNNDDLKNINTKEAAWEHWTNYGKNENRLFKKRDKKEFIFDK